MAGERDLISRAARGDRRAFDALIEDRWEKMVRIARRVIGDPEEARDVAQAACLRVWETLDRFRPGEDLDGWIYRVVVNMAIDATRRRKARPEDGWPTRKEGDWSLDPPSRARAPDVAAFARELEAALEELTRDLPPRQKAVFVLSRVEGMSAPEVARVMDISPSTVRNHMAQLRAELGRRLRARYPDLLGAGAAGSGEDDEG